MNNHHIGICSQHAAIHLASTIFSLVNNSNADLSSDFSTVQHN